MKNTPIPRFVFLALLLPLTFSACSKPAGPVDCYELEGDVTRVDSKVKSVTVKHRPIKNAQGKVWMAAMTMEFPVKDDADFAKLEEGAHIKAKLCQRPSDLEYWIGQVTVLP
ncbi:MAG: copper-binding protein [Bryobacterales bacterium]|nr:copper-binding protein [Bryobacterales bacterium]